MNPAQTLKNQQEATNKALRALSHRIMQFKEKVNQSSLSQKMKDGYLDILNKEMAKINNVKEQVNKPNKNSYQASLDIKKHMQQTSKIALNLKTIDGALTSAATKAQKTNPARNSTRPLANTPPKQAAYDFPEVPTGFHPKKPAKAPPPTVPSATLGKFVAVDKQLSSMNSKLRELQSLKLDSTEKKVERYALVHEIKKEQAALQNQLNRIVNYINTAKAPLSRAQDAALNKELDKTSKKISHHENRITKAYVNGMPKAPKTARLRQDLNKLRDKSKKNDGGNKPSNNRSMNP
jgi:hypothetical protein